MSSNRDLESRIADFYAQEGLLRAPDRVLNSALTTIETTKQRRVLGRLFGRVSWRFPDMSNYLKIAVAAVALIAALGVGFALYSSRPPGPGGTLVPTSSPPTSPTIGPSPTPVGSSFPALTERYTSEVHGITVSYPGEWTTKPATEPWVSGELSKDAVFADAMWDARQDATIALASQPLNGKTPTAWAAEFLATRPCGTTERYTIAGVDGVITECDDGAHAVVATGDRAHVIWLYLIKDMDYFKEILGTVQLDPGNALISSDPFGAPFTFRSPAGPRWDFDGVDPTTFDWRVPEYNDAGHPGGMTALAIGGGREDPCDPESAELAIDPGPQAVIDYLGTVPGISLVEESATTVDGLEAVQAIVPATTETPSCEAFIWSVDTEPFAGIPLEVSRRVIAVDVGGEHVVFTTYGEENNPGMTEQVDQLLDSITFTGVN